MQSNLDTRVLLSLVEERQARLRRTTLLVGREHDRRLVRRWIGRQLMSLGQRLANEQPMRPVRAR